jgi:hypothetical protein
MKLVTGDIFGFPLLGDSGDGPSIAARMLGRVLKPNLLAELVSAKRLNRGSASFVDMSGDSIPGFPLLTLADLRILALGSYQLKQALSYYAEHSKADGRYLIQLCRHTGPLELTSHCISAEDPMLIRRRLQSRYQNSTKYFIYILVDVEKSGVEAVVEYTCQCKNSLRTVGYLGYGRHQPEIPLPAVSQDEVCVVETSTDEDST